LYLYRSLTFNKITGKQILHKKLIIKSNIGLFCRFQS
jgi:hypothetical protein